MFLDKEPLNKLRQQCLKSYFRVLVLCALDFTTRIRKLADGAPVLLLSKTCGRSFNSIPCFNAMLLSDHDTPLVAALDFILFTVGS